MKAQANIQQQQDDIHSEDASRVADNPSPPTGKYQSGNKMH